MRNWVSNEALARNMTLLAYIMVCGAMAATFTQSLLYEVSHPSINVLSEINNLLLHLPRYANPQL